jgi:dolichol kinase
MIEYFWACVLTGVALVAMVASNYAFKSGLSFYASRKIAHFGAAIPIVLLPVFFSSMLYPVILSSGLLLVVLISHKRNLFPGFARHGRLSEIYFPLSVLVSILIFWSTSPWVAIAPPLMLSLGDGITGVVRKFVYKEEIKGNWGSFACFIVCALIGVILLPSILTGLISALAATLAERFCGDSKGSIIKIDDNLAMPLSAIVVIVIFSIW